MAKRKKGTFGNTWWGERWVEGLESVVSNRLERGKRYANKGKVKKIILDKNKVFATVKGSYSSVYRVNITVKPFYYIQLKTIKKILATNQEYIIELEMGNISCDLVDDLKASGVELFPYSWMDFDSFCSCPDNADPCKHIAAVYYQLANVIDNDPFKLFEIRGIEKKDLIDEKKIKNISKILNRTHKTTLKKDILDLNTLKPSYSRRLRKEYPNFEFDFPDSRIQDLLNILDDRPPFYNRGDFKQNLKTIYDVVGKNISELIEFVDEFPELTHREFQFELIENHYILKIGHDSEDIGSLLKMLLKDFYDKIENIIPFDFFLDPEERYILKLRRKEENFFLEKRKALSGRQLDYRLLDFFLVSSLNIDIEKTSDSYLYILLLTSCALEFVRSGNFLPEVVFEKRNSFCVRYVPLMGADVIENKVKKIQEVFIPGIASYKEKLLSKESFYDIISFIITYIVKKLIPSKHFTEENKLIRVFCDDYIFKTEGVHEKNIGKNIDNWLQRINIKNTNLSPVIKIDDTDGDDFLLSIEVENKKKKLVSNIEYSDLFDSNKKNRENLKKYFYPLSFDEGRSYIMKKVYIASEYIYELKKIIYNDENNKIYKIPMSSVSNFLVNHAETFEIMGINIILPKEFKNIIKPDLNTKVRTKSSKKNVSSYLNIENILEFSYEISLGDEKITPEEFFEIVGQTKGLIRYKDRYILLKPHEIKELIQRLQTPLPKMNSPVETLYTLFSGEYNGTLFDFDKKTQDLLEDIRTIKNVRVPKNLNARLRPYQERGYKWLCSNSEKGLGSCIADDMGLGKTIQVITLLLYFKNKNKNISTSLIICPTTLIGNWEKECQKFAPDLKLNIYHGNERSMKMKNYDLVISSYGTVRNDIKKFKTKKFEFVIIDEAQNIKNPDTAQTKAVKSLNGKVSIAMTGTPVENRLVELWSIFDFINRGYLGDINRFIKRFVIPIEKFKSKEELKRLKKVTAPFLLRRLKTDKKIINDLPEKIVYDEYCYLTKEQSALYQNIIDESLKSIEEFSGIERKGMIFKLIISLKQICNHPSNFLKDNNHILNISGKALKTISILKKILEKKEKALIFTQYKEMGRILKDIISKELMEDAEFFHGGLSRKKRDKLVKDFQENEGNKVMIVSLKAGGTGLNLTKATNVIHYDLWWNPAVENQATDRCFRIGQKKNVVVYRLITIGTFEEKIDEIIKSKKELADMSISTGERWISEMSNEELEEIFKFV